MTCYVDLIRAKIESSPEVVEALFKNLASVLADASESVEFPDDFDIYSRSGGNLDDAFECGVDHGCAIGEYDTIGEIFRTFEVDLPA